MRDAALVLAGAAAAAACFWLVDKFGGDLASAFTAFSQAKRHPKGKYSRTSVRPKYRRANSANRSKEPGISLAFRKATLDDLKVLRRLEQGVEPATPVPVMVSPMHCD